MGFGKSLLIAAVFSAVTATGAAAQAPQWPSLPYVQSYPYNPAPNTPPAWSYNPYTSGIGPCVQANRGNSPPCRETLVPTAGQPNYSVPR
jgi:hypothetical protein